MKLDRDTPSDLIIAVVTLIGLIVGVPVFAYSNFVTIRERDSMRTVTLDRIDALEKDMKENTQQESELKGKIDTLILMEQQRK